MRRKQREYISRTELVGRAISTVASEEMRAGVYLGRCVEEVSMDCAKVKGTYHHPHGDIHTKSVFSFV